MHRTLALVVLIAVPAFELSAQGRSRGEESDSTESSGAGAIAIGGGMGFKFLRAALGDGDSQTQRICLGSCGVRSRSAALALTAGPTAYLLNDSENTAASNNSKANGKGSEAKSLTGSEHSSLRNERADEVARNDDHPEHPNHPFKAKGPKTSDSDTPGNGNNPWDSGVDVGCALHACVNPIPLPPIGTSGNDDPNWVEPQTIGTLPPFALQEVPVIVNPEPGTWAMLAAGMGGLLLMRRRRR